MRIAQSRSSSMPHPFKHNCSDCSLAELKSLNLDNARPKWGSLAGQPVGEQENKTSKQDSQQHHPKPRATSPLQPRVRDHFSTGGHNTKRGPVGTGVSPRGGHSTIWDATLADQLPLPAREIVVCLILTS